MKTLSVRIWQSLEDILRRRLQGRRMMGGKKRTNLFFLSGCTIFVNEDGGQLIVSVFFLPFYAVREACTSCAVCVLDVGPCWTWGAVPELGSDGWVGPAHGTLGPHSFEAWPSIPGRELWAGGRESGPHPTRPNINKLVISFFGIE